MNQTHFIIFTLRGTQGKSQRIQQSLDISYLRANDEADKLLSLQDIS